MSFQIALIVTALALAGTGGIWGCSQPELIVYESEGYTNTGAYVEMARRFDSRLDVPVYSAYGVRLRIFSFC